MTAAHWSDDWPGYFWDGMYLKLIPGESAILLYDDPSSGTYYTLSGGAGGDFDIKCGSDFWTYDGKAREDEQLISWAKACGVILEDAPIVQSSYIDTQTDICAHHTCPVCKQKTLEHQIVYVTHKEHYGSNKWTDYHFQCILLQKIREAKVKTNPSAVTKTEAPKPERWPEQYQVIVPQGAIPNRRRDDSVTAYNERRLAILRDHELLLLRGLQNTLLEWPRCTEHWEAAVMDWDERYVDKLDATGQFYCPKCDPKGD